MVWPSAQGVLTLGPPRSAAGRGQARSAGAFEGRACGWNRSPCSTRTAHAVQQPMRHA